MTCQASRLTSEMILMNPVDIFSFGVCFLVLYYIPDNVLDTQ